jgi:hypothetical protein
MKTTYVIVEKEFGRPLRLRSEHNGKDRYACGEYSYSLVDREDLPLFECASPEAAQEIIFFPPEWYNSTAKSPTLGCYEQEDLAIYEMRVSLTLVDTREPLIIDEKGTSQRRQLPYAIAKRLAPEAPKDKPSMVVVLDTAKAGVSEDQIRERIGGYVYFGKYDKKLLYGVAKAREEWREFGDLELVYG